MSLTHLQYKLQNGFVSNWLVAGPQAIPIPDLQHFTGEDFRQQIARRAYEADPGFTGSPVERGPLTEGAFHAGDYAGAWTYVRCAEDHFVDQSGDYPTCCYLRSWAYAEIVTRRDQQVWLLTTTYGPADLWLDGVHIHRQEHFHDRQPLSVPLEVGLQRGVHRILVRFENVAVQRCPHVLALRICRPEPGEMAPAAGIRVRLPTSIEKVRRRNRLEQVFEAATLDREVFERDDRILVRWPETMEGEAITSVRLQTPSGRIYAEAREKGSPGDQAFLGRAGEVPPGPYRILLMPGPREYYEGNRRVRRELCLWSVGNHVYSHSPYSTLPERRQEALTYASKREGSLFTEIARMALGRWPAVEIKVILEAVQSVRQRKAGSNLELAGLLGICYRFGRKAEFPQELWQPLEDCILNFKYWHDEPGREVMSFEPESQRILFHIGEILAGQLYPEKTFTHSGQTGKWHRERGERLALGWLHERGSWGFGEWDSPGSFAEDLTALSHLVDLAESEQVWEMASVLMDKIFLTVGLNSYRGVFGSSHGRASAQGVQGGLLEAMSGITRLMWGQGIFNHHLAGTVSLACMERYELPAMLAEIATALPAGLWSRERHAIPPPDQGTATREVNKVAYKTPDYMLCSAQDYYPGEAGWQEHIWQATLSPTAVVFANHPACAHGEDALRPNFWLGNAVLPRVAQWQDVLIAIYKLGREDWMGFTHAYFPTYAFDEWVLRNGWAFARKGNGYLALTASQELHLITRGQSAYRELRSEGLHAVWLCHMGRAALDGDFATFQEKICGRTVAFDDLSARCDTLRGDSLSFGWKEPFLRNGQEQPLRGFPHYENPYVNADLPCTQMDIRLGDELLRLDFSPPGTGASG